jgi:starvation-inducible outer membrane lipoprotein
MKALILLTALLTGCATPPTAFQRQMILMQMSRPAYQLPAPPAMAPVNRQVTCYTNGNVTTCQ